jgi:hypothetical protein
MLNDLLSQYRSEKDRQDMLFRQRAILTMRRLPPLDQSLSA